MILYDYFEHMQFLREILIIFLLHALRKININYMLYIFVIFLTLEILKTPPMLSF